MLIILTGPAGAGKSTIGEKLALAFPRSVNFSLDDLRHFVKGGYVDPWDDTDEEGQSVLATRIAIGMIKEYLAKDFVVIIDDVFNDNGVSEYKKYFDDVHAFLLLPTVETIQQRDSGRSPDKQMGSRAIEMHANFTNQDYELLTVIDSTNQTPYETVQQIIHELNGQTS